MHFLGIDWGGTYIKAGIIDKENRLLEDLVLLSNEFKRKEVFIEKIEDIVKNFKRYNIKAIGIGAPGIIDVKKGFIYYLPNIPGWRNYPLSKVLKKKLNLEVFIDNDANVFALAESRVGIAKGKQVAIFLTLGTGLGGAVLLAGKILRSRTSASELGHIPMSIDGKKCSCGGSGCIETFVGAKYILEEYNRLKNCKAKEVKEIYESALKNDKIALKIWENFANALGKFLAGLVNVFNPEMIVLGGGVSGAFRIFKPKLLEVIKKQAMWPHTKDLKIVKAKLKKPGIIGAGILAKEGINEVIY